MPKQLKIFLSYASEQLELADRLQLALANAGHELFFDRTALPAGRDYHPAILAALRGADLMVFLISPASVAPGAYPLSELRLARDIWSTPEGRVLPVMAEETPIDSVPAYLRAVSILHPEGDVVAEVHAAIDVLTSGWSPVQTAVGQARQVEATALQLKLMRLEERAARMEANWAAKQKELSFQLNGRDTEPTVAAAFGVVFVSLLMSGFFFSLTVGSPFGLGFFEVVFCLFPVVAGVGAFWVICRKAKQYEEAEKEYHASRKALREEMRQVRSQSNAGSPLSL